MRQKDIFLFWLPLFASWLLMTAEGPVISAAINRLPDEVIMLAAQGIIVSLSVTIESPIINLLATATALVRDRRSYLLVRRFTVHWMIALTVVTVLVAFTPLFDLVVVRLLGTPAEVAIWVRPGLRIMTLWSAAIAWRRFLQGVLIRFKQTRKVGWGTLVRLTASGGGAILLAVTTSWPGVVIGTTGLMLGVTAEAIYATIAVRPLLRAELAEDRPPTSATPLTYRELFWFHLPLAGTSLLVLLAQPLVTSSLARLANPTQSLAAWPLIFQLMLMMRAIALALPEAVIALTNGPDDHPPLRRFSLTLAAISTGIIVLFAATPLARLYFFQVQDATPQVGILAQEGLLFFLLLPGLTTLVSWVRGLLINHRRTAVVNAGMALNLVATVVVLGAGIWGGWRGIPTAAVALSVAIAVELVFLLWRAGRALGLRLLSPDMGSGRPPHGAVSV